jgi:NAD(P)-dependent dehydrogenase (short-subunit alcohol dehydrogenase family)
MTAASNNEPDRQKSVIVTGAASGIGLAIAQAAEQAGYRTGLLDFDPAGLDEAAASMNSAEILIADVTSETEVHQAFDEFGTPALVVRTYIVAREAARRMIEAGGGHIINLSSINSITPGPGAGAYPATKAAVAQMTRQLAIELGPDQVRVNAIAPGFIDAGMSAPIYDDEKVRELRSGAVPAGRLGLAEDIANAVLFLDSEKGSYINGHELVIDGGVVHSLLNQLPRE